MALVWEPHVHGAEAGGIPPAPRFPSGRLWESWRRSDRFQTGVGLAWGVGLVLCATAGWLPPWPRVIAYYGWAGVLPALMQLARWQERRVRRRLRAGGWQEPGTALYRVALSTYWPREYQAPDGWREWYWSPYPGIRPTQVVEAVHLLMRQRFADSPSVNMLRMCMSGDRPLTEEEMRTRSLCLASFPACCVRAEVRRLLGNRETLEAELTFALLLLERPDV